MVARRRKIESVKRSTRQHRWRVWAVLVTSAALTACAVPSPYQQPAPPPPSPRKRRPLKHVLASRRAPSRSRNRRRRRWCANRRSEPHRARWSSQAQTQLATKNYAVAASSLERALRIEPDNPLLWIELGKVRLAEGNYVQAENMARKAVSMSVNAPRAQSSAWRLIAESYRARGKNIEAQEAQARADSLNSG